jgi:WD40 repeat protein
LASGSRDNTVKLWSVEWQNEVTTLQGHSSYVFSVAFSPDGKYLASGSDDKTVKLWSIENFQDF